MKVLAADTSSPFGVIGISENGTLLGEISIRSMETHSARLLPSIDYLLRSLTITLEEIDLFGVVLGPGSFTGLRVGMATIKGFAWTQKKPLVGLSSLEVLAHNALGYPRYIAPMLDARKKRVYGAIYSWKKGQLATVVAPSDMKATELIQKTKDPLVCFGTGARVYQSEISDTGGDRVEFGPADLDIPRGLTVAGLTLQKFKIGNTIDIHKAEPTYLRLSEAEVKQKGLHA